jgi:hypothetical protein
MVLPDSGNRAKCIVSYEIYKKLFPNGKLEPYEEKISTAKPNNFLDIIGRSKSKLTFLFARRNVEYTVRPLIAKRLQLPCLLSTHDLEKLKMQVNYDSKIVTFGNGVTDRLMADQSQSEVTATLLYKERIAPMEEVLIPVLIDGQCEPDVPILIEPTQDVWDQYHLTSVPSLNRMMNKNVGHLKIWNLNDHPVELKQGIKIGTAVVGKLEIMNSPRPQGGRLHPKQIREKLRQDFKLSENAKLNPGQRNELLELLYEFSDCISQGPADIGLCKEITCKIHVEEGKTCNAHLRPLPPHLKESFKEQLSNWIDKGIVERAEDSCPFSSALVPVRKKNGEIRWAVDYRALNKITRKDRRPVPNVFEKLASLKADTRKSFRYFASLDLQDAFHNIPMDEQSKDPTAIITPFGLYRFLRMPFGLAAAPNVFSDMINLLLEKIKRINPELAPQILIYFDDGLICAQDWNEFLTILRLFLEAIKQMRLKLNAKKCVLAVSSIKWLGHEISNKGIQPDPQLVSTIQNWPPPTNLTELRALFGTLSYYRRFVKNFSARVSNMRELLRKDVPFIWNDMHTHELIDLKDALCNRPILGHPDFTEKAEPFILYVDSSKQGIGAVLTQKQPLSFDESVRHEEVVIAYASKSLTTGEQHYSAYKKELVGVVYAVNHFRYYLLGKKFAIKTDHRALEWLLHTRSKSVPALIYRWQDVLSEYEFDIQYVPGKQMQHVDGLSRKSYVENDPGVIKDISDESWLPVIKEKFIASLTSERPKRIIRKPKRYRTDSDTDSETETRKYKGKKLPNRKTQIQTNQKMDPLNNRVATQSPPDVMTDMDQLLRTPSPTFLDDEPDVLVNEPEIDLYYDSDAELDEEEEIQNDAEGESEVIQPALVPYAFQRMSPEQIKEKQQNDDILGKLIPIVEQEGHLTMTKEGFQEEFNLTDNPKFQPFFRNLKNFVLDERAILRIKQPLPLGEGSGTRTKIVLPQDLGQDLMSQIHVMEVHPGYNVLEIITSERYWWPLLKQDAQLITSQCNTCRRIKDPKPDFNSPLGQTTSRKNPHLRHWSIDFVHFPTSRQGQYNYLLTMMEYTTRWFEAYPIKKANSTTVKRILLNEFLPRYGPGCKITSDQDRAFVSDIMRQVIQDADLKAVTTIAYNPKANPVERIHKELKKKILFLLEQETREEDKRESRWAEVLPRAIWNLRTTPSTVTKLSPWFQVYGTQPYLSSDVLTNIEVEENSDRQESQTSTRISDTQISTLKLVQARHDQNQQRRSQKGKLVYFPVGTMVDVWRPYDVKDGRRTRKFTRHWSGPYIVQEHNYDAPYRVRVGPADNSGAWQRPIHVDHVRKQKQFVPPTDRLLPGGWQPVAPPYNLHKNRKPDFRQRLDQELRTNQQIDPRYLQHLNQPKRGRNPNDGFTPNTTKEDWLSQYHQKYPNGFQQTDDISTDDESGDDDYPEYKPQTITAPVTAPVEETMDQSPSTSRRHRQPDDLPIQDSMPTPRSQPDTVDRFIAPQPIPSTSQFEYNRNHSPAHHRRSHDDLRQRIGRSRSISQNSTASIRSKRERSLSQERDLEPPSQRSRRDHVSYLSNPSRQHVQTTSFTNNAAWGNVRTMTPSRGNGRNYFGHIQRRGDYYGSR